MKVGKLYTAHNGFAVYEWRGLTREEDDVGDTGNYQHFTRDELVMVLEFIVVRDGCRVKFLRADGSVVYLRLTEDPYAEDSAISRLSVDFFTEVTSC